MKKPSLRPDIIPHMVEAVPKCSPTLSPSLSRPVSDIRVFWRPVRPAWYPGCFSFTSMPGGGSVLFGGSRNELACNSDVDPILEVSSSETAVHVDAKGR